MGKMLLSPYADLLVGHFWVQPSCPLKYMGPIFHKILLQNQDKHMKQTPMSTSNTCNLLDEHSLLRQQMNC
jgi:hypothetical protein